MKVSEYNYVKPHPNNYKITLQTSKEDYDGAFQQYETALGPALQVLQGISIYCYLSSRYLKTHLSYL